MGVPGSALHLEYTIGLRSAGRSQGKIEEKIADINSLKIDSKFSKPDAKIIDIKGKNHYQARSASIRQISSSSSQAAIPLFYNLIYK
jgi:hypothetical protein